VMPAAARLRMGIQNRPQTSPEKAQASFARVSVFTDRARGSEIALDLTDEDRKRCTGHRMGTVLGPLFEEDEVALPVDIAVIVDEFALKDQKLLMTDVFMRL